MKQTSVEWLYNEWVKNGTIFLEDLEQAKEMEKEQIIDFAWSISVYERKEIAKYYNETYKNGNK